MREERAAEGNTQSTAQQTPDRKAEAPEGITVKIQWAHKEL